MNIALVGDIGGTNARFALWIDGRLEAVRVLPTAAFEGPEAAIRAYLRLVGQTVDTLQAVCLACAGPVTGDAFTFTNNHWRLHQAAFRQTLGLRDLLLINDFAAMALGMTRLQAHESVPVCAGERALDQPRLVIGPGTGLGVATLLPMAHGGWRALPGEGGHACLPVGNTREAALWQYLHAQRGHVNAEAVLSGGGLLALYQASCALDGLEPQLASPVEITAAALVGEGYAAQVLQQFCLWLGRVVGDKALTVGARGGVYLAGGMLPRFAGFFLDSAFLDGFRDKGSMRSYMQAIPICLVTAQYPGLEGAGVALQQRSASSPDTRQNS